MGFDLFSLIAGLLLIIKGGDWFVAAAVRLAEFLKMPRVVIGSTLVSLATTTPELVVSLMAGAKGESGLAVGNAVGSCICNIGLILGVTACIRSVELHPKTLRRPLAVMIGAGLLLLLFTWNLRIERWQGVLLIAAGAIYFVWDFLHHLRRRSLSELVEATALEQSMERRFIWLHSKLGTACQFLGGAGVVIIGSRLLVDGAVIIAQALGVPSLVIGLTIVAIGTSLPELVTAVTSSRQAVSDLAVGNVIGANIANLTLIVGAASVIQAVKIDRVTQLFHFPTMLAVMGLILWKLASDRRLGRRDGIILIASYILYLSAVAGLAFFLREAPAAVTG
ncbi:MAG: calcium/sodium antiporter [Chthoniobacteraceae bacterium]